MSTEAPDLAGPLGWDGGVGASRKLLTPKYIQVTILGDASFDPLVKVFSSDSHHCQGTSSVSS